MESKSLIFRIRKNSFPFQHSGLAKSLRTGDHELPNSYKSMKQGERKIDKNGVSKNQQVRIWSQF